MTTVLIVFACMVAVVTAMAVGVLMGRKPISGSCGGMSALGMEVACDICGGDKGKCEKETKKVRAQVSTDDQFYDATK
ncbi:(Na+)-NQR maturation NqrM [Rhodanobacter aciditrophus]|uniref:(Na+)-NQR maturation NqrM n=1 Tax=Rhodanobacter aciditrophus TaxID=1623218 RepID=A0ABW4AZU6_9GAMM